MRAAVLIALVLTLAAPKAPPAPRGQDGGEVSAPLAAGDRLRCEYFVLEAVVPPPPGRLAEGEPDPLAGPLAVAAWRRRDKRGETVLERDFVFPGGVRAWHVERHGPARSRLIWRELGPDGGRSWFCEWDPEDRSWETTSWGLGDPIHGLAAGGREVRMPLQLAERVREGRTSAGTLPCFDPLRGCVEACHLERGGTAALAPEVVARLVEPGESPRVLDVVDVRRADQSLVVRLIYRADELAGFQLHDGELLARRIDAETYEELFHRWAPTEWPRPAYEQLERYLDFRAEARRRLPE